MERKGKERKGKEGKGKKKKGKERKGKERKRKGKKKKRKENEYLGSLIVGFYSKNLRKVLPCFLIKPLSLMSYGPPQVCYKN